MVDRFISIAQGAVGVLEEGCKTVGFYTDKIEPCRPYVFVCTGGTLMVHDTGQIQLDALCDFIALHGRIKAVHFVEGQQHQEKTHHNRRGCKNFCVNGHLAGNCRASRSDDDRSKENRTEGIAG